MAASATDLALFGAFDHSNFDPFAFAQDIASCFGLRDSDFELPGACPGPIGFVWQKDPSETPPACRVLVNPSTDLASFRTFSFARHQPLPQAFSRNRAAPPNNQSSVIDNQSPLPRGHAFCFSLYERPLGVSSRIQGFFTISH